MKQPYHTPCVELLMLANEDILTTSLTVSQQAGIGNNNSVDCSGWISGSN